MTLGRAYELGLLLATTVALLAVLLGGELPVVAWASLAAPPYSVYARRPLPPQVGTASGVLGVAAIGYSVVVRGAEGLVLGGALFLVAVLVGRLLTRSSLRHDLQALLMALLLVFAGTVLHTQITYGLIFVAFAVSMVWAMVARQLVAGAHLEAERRGGAPLAATLARRDVVTVTFLGVTGGLSLVLLLAAAGLFLAFPRVGIGALSFLARSHDALPEDVSLTGDPRGLGGGEVIARVTGISEAAFDRGLYLRGPVYDQLGRDGFRRTDLARAWGSPATRMAAAEDDGTYYEVTMQPVAGNTLFTLGPVTRAGVLSGGATNPSIRRRLVPVGYHPELRTFRPLSGPARIGVLGSIAHGSPARREVAPDEPVPSALEPFLQLPPDLDERIPPLAAGMAGEGDLFTRANRLRRFLRDDFTYSLDQVNGDKPDPLAGFLFEDREGHCEYFATAFAVMLRSQDIPARVVGGFSGGIWDDSGEVAVFTAGSAHAWVEWYVPGHGWITDDATPAGALGALRFSGFGVLWERLSRFWDDYVIEYNLMTQWQLFAGAARELFGTSEGRGWRRIQWRRGAKWIGGLAAVAALAWFIWVRRSTRRPWPPEDPIGRALRRALERLRGDSLPASMTLREGVEEQGTHRALLDEALVAYERHRFAGRPAAFSRQSRLARALARVR